MIGISREDAQRRYAQVSADIGETLACLAVTGQPLDRYVLLTRRAEAEQELAELHTAAFGPDPIVAEDGRDMAESLAGSARLLHLVASTELAVALAEWSLVQDLLPGARFWHRDRWQTVVAVVAGSSPDTWRVEFADGAEDTVYVHDDPVRTDGDATFEVCDLVLGSGGTATEAREWGRLAATAPRDIRAAWLRNLLAEMAARRVGDRAAGVLHDLADEEDRLAVSAVDACSGWPDIDQMSSTSEVLTDRPIDYWPVPQPPAAPVARAGGCLPAMSSALPALLPALLAVLLLGFLTGVLAGTLPGPARMALAVLAAAVLAARTTADEGTTRS